MEERALDDPGASRCRYGQRAFGFGFGSHACGTHDDGSSGE
ncbi:hypothetical protein SHJG_8169 [Streptomyces hygroscopicus subsp. jinggangensis 5008]|nr:hypothetical protein SHJG_8169 [Streptomyces hygroscopicus subsp. jinggangensis 5008]